jgi:hypothetical protein
MSFAGAEDESVAQEAEPVAAEEPAPVPAPVPEPEPELVFQGEEKDTAFFWEC